MFRSPWLLTFVTLSPAVGATPVQKLSTPEAIHSWIKAVPPKVGTPEMDAAAKSEYEWQVEMKDGRPVAHRRNVKAEEATALPALIKRNRGPHPEPGDIHTTQVSDGWLIAFNTGDSGGSLWWYSADGRQRYKISDEQIIQFLPARRGLFALEGVEHFNSARGRLIQLQQNEQRQWVSSTFYDLEHTPDVGMLESGGDFLISTTDTLVRVHPDKTATVLIPQVFWKGLSPRSIAISPQGDIYLGMHQGVSIVYPFNHAFNADWLLPSKDFLLTSPK